MEMQFEHMLEKITDFMRSEAKTETIMGEPFDLGAFKCVPVIRVGMGFGSGGGQGDDPKKGKGTGGGAGGGVGIEPIGFLVTKDDHISFVPANKSHGLSAVFEKVPDLIEKLARTQKEKQPVL